MRLLEVKNLSTILETVRGNVYAVRGIDFYVDEGETVALVGESGCGKTMTCMSVLNLFIRNAGKISKDSQILFEGKDLSKYTEKEMQSVRGAQIGMVFQEPGKALNPSEKIGGQIVDILLAHKKMKKKEAEEEAVRLLGKVGISDAPKRMKQYPHELSGGMKQRVVIAMAIACRPKLLIADEPTTALDVTIQAQILELLKELQKEYGMAVLIVTHNMGVVSAIADRVLVMYGGKLLEEGTVRQIFHEAKHPYTQALLRTLPKERQRKTRLPVIPGTPPLLTEEREGCPFCARCPYRMVICQETFPNRREEGGHGCFCFREYEEYKSIMRKGGDRCGNSDGSKKSE